MRKPVYSLFALVVSLLMLTACGTESGSSSLMALLGLGGGGAQFTKQFGTGMPVNSTTIPFNSGSDIKVQFLYTAAEVGGSGYITKIRLLAFGSDEENRTCKNITIKMGHTSLSALTTTWANNVETGQGAEITVLNNKTITVPKAADGSWITITLDRPFNYNGVDNLVVDYESSTKCSGYVSCIYTSTANREAPSMTVDNAAGVPEFDTVNADSVGSSLIWMQFVFAGGDNRLIHTGVTTTYPFRSDTPHWCVQMLIPASEINGSGEITGIAFAAGDSPTSAGVFKIGVYVSQISSNTLVTTSFSDNLDIRDFVLAVETADFIVPAGVPAGSYLWLPVKNSFKYNGTDNLIVYVIVQSVTGANFAIQLDNGGTGTALFGTNTPNATVENCRFNMKLRFKGSTADIIGSGNHNLYPPFHGTVTGQFQPLYRGAELGINGSIDSIAFRLKNDSAAESYGNISISIGHSDLDALALGPAYLDNMVGEQTVFTGTVSVPAGLKAGDWVDIPLDTAFTCTPGKNLAIYIRHDAGSAGIENYVQGENDAARYPGRLLGTENQTLHEPGWVADILPSIRFGLK
jgi:hypothetical protein